MTKKTNWKATRANVHNWINPVVSYATLAEYYVAHKSTIKRWLEEKDKEMKEGFLQDIADLLDIEIDRLLIIDENRVVRPDAKIGANGKKIQTVEELSEKIEYNRAKRLEREKIKSSIQTNRDHAHAAMRSDLELNARVYMLERLFALSLEGSETIIDQITIRETNSYDEFMEQLNRSFLKLDLQQREYVHVCAMRMCGIWPQDQPIPSGESYWLGWRMQRSSEEDYNLDAKEAAQVELAYEALDPDFKATLEEVHENELEEMALWDEENFYY